MLGGVVVARLDAALVDVEDLLALLAEVLGHQLEAILERRVEEFHQRAERDHVLAAAAARVLVRQILERKLDLAAALEPVVRRAELGVVQERAVLRDRIDVTVVGELVERAVDVDDLLERSRRPRTRAQLEQRQAAADLGREGAEGVDVEPCAGHGLREDLAAGDDPFAALAADLDDQVLANHRNLQRKVSPIGGSPDPCERQAFPPTRSRAGQK